MGGRGGSSGIRGGQLNVSGRNIYSDYIDSESLTDKQIDQINLARSDVWRNAREYIKETDKPQEVELTKTQRDLYNKAVYDGDFSGFSSASPKTLEAVKKKVESDYYDSQKVLASGNYDVRQDYVRIPGRKPYAVAGKSFVSEYKNRQKSARILNEINEALEKKGKDAYKFGREITSSAYKRSVSRKSKQVDLMFRKRK